MVLSTYLNTRAGLARRAGPLLLAGLALLPWAARAQAPAVVRAGLVPAANANTAAPAAPVVVPFSQPIDPATAGNVRVFSAQYRGRRTATASTSGNTVTLTPTAPGPAAAAAFRPGETVGVTVPATVLSTGGAAAVPHVYEFTTAVGGTGQGNFLPPPSNPNVYVGSTPFDVAVGDVDGDNDLDVLTATLNNGMVSVRLNDGTGSFTAPATNAEVAVGSGGIGLALGDVDADGDLDLVASNYNDATVSVRLNDGTGGFTAPATTPEVAVGTTPQAVALADVDGDGDLDLLTTNNGDATVSVRLNNGTGTFGGGGDYSTAATPSGLALADVDADGDLDFVTSNIVGSLSVRLNDGQGSFGGGADLATGSQAYAVKLGDVNGDGALDLVTCNTDFNTVSVFFNTNNGTGGFTSASVFSVGDYPIGVTLGDVDADGDLDLMVSSFGGTTVSLRLNNGQGSFTAPAANAELAVGYYPISTVLADVDADGDVDLVAANYGSSSISVRINNARTFIAGFAPKVGTAGTVVTLTGLGFTGASAVAFNGTAAASFVVDSDTRITATVAAGTSTGLLSVTTANGTALSPAAFTVVPAQLVVTALSPARNAHAAAPASAVAVTFDQAPTAASADNIRLFSGQYHGLRPATTAVSGTTATRTPTGGFGPGELVSVTIPAAVQDAAGNPAVKQVYQFTTAVGGSGQGNFQPALTNANPAVGANPTGVATGDVDGDGDLDFLTANKDGNTVSLRLNDGTGNFIAPATGAEVAMGSSPGGLVLGDVDADGDLDFVTANPNDNTVSVRLNDGAGHFSPLAGASSFAVDSNPVGLTLGDVDADGDLDVLTANKDGNTVSVRLNDGTGRFTGLSATPNVAVGSNPVSVTVGDVDGDGDLDLLAANTNDGTVSVRLNDGEGDFTAPAANAEVAVDYACSSVALGDVDADGDLDVLASNYGTVSVRLNNGTGSFTAPATNSEVTVGNGANGLTLGDVDADGDLDFVTASQYDNTVSVRLNDGLGSFTAPTAGAEASVARTPQALALGDVDADGDLDVLTANYGGTVSVRLNNIRTFIISFAPKVGTAGTVVTLTGLGFTGASAVAFNGTAAASFVVDSDTRITATVAAGTTTGLISVTTANGTALSPAAFTVVPAQLVVTALSPARNAHAAAPASAVAVTFDQAPTAASADNIRLFSGQYHGLRPATTAVSGTTATRTPTGGFGPGEAVSVTIPAAVQDASGNPAVKQVYQFTTAVGGSGQGNFQPALTNANPAVGANPTGVATGDVDGDGDLDFLTANISDNTVSVRLNDGTGNFTAPATGAEVAVGSSPYSLVLGDVDADGDLDFLTANSAGSTISVRLNDGTGHFTAPAANAEVAVGLSVYRVVLGDVDADGDLDFLAANAGDRTVSVRLNDGMGHFTAPAFSPEVAVSGNVNGLALGDVDADGDLDFLSFNDDNSLVSVRLNDGEGIFSAPAANAEVASGSFPVSLALGDVDADGDLDFLTTNNGDNTVSVRFNDGTGNFIARATHPDVAVGSSPVSLALGDVDADGDLDFLVANTNDNTVSVRLNDGGGRFIAPASNAEVAGGQSPFSLALGDVDADGDLDFLTTNFYDNTVSVRLNNVGTLIASFAPPRGLVGTVVTITGSGFTGASAVAFNGTAAASFVVNSNTQITATVAVGSTTGLITVTTPLGVASSATAFEVLQPLTITALSPARNARAAAPATPVAVTFDRAPTVASAENIRIFSSQYKGLRAATTAVSGTTATRTPTGGNFRPGEVVSVTVPATVLDANGIYTNRQVYQFSTAVGGTGRGKFLNPSTNATTPMGSDAADMTVGDVDGDGNLDLLTADYRNNAVSVRLNDGRARFTAPATNAEVAVGRSPYGLVLGDVDADGDLDLLTANYVGSTVSVRLNNGTGNFTAPATNAEVAVGTRPVGLTLGDVDADGDLDVLTTNTRVNTVSLRLNDGMGNFTAPATDAEIAFGDVPSRVVLGDVDSDGDLDLLVVNGTAGVISVRLNDGAGHFSAPATNAELAVTGGAKDVVLGDLDADGDLDLLASNSDNDPSLASYSQPGTVFLLLNDGTGNFTAPATNATFSVPPKPGYLVVRDVDADGDLDLLLGNGTSYYSSAPKVPTSVYLNDGQARFTAYGNYASASGSGPLIVVADLDNDGDVDLLTANGDINTVSLRLNRELTALPVELTAFTATAQGNTAVRLAWATATEKNSQAFEVERSADGTAFARIGTVPAAGSSSAPRPYELLDRQLPAGAATLYYRLKQVDLDGTFSYSPVRTVALTGAAAGLSLYPNPTRSGAATLTGVAPGAAVTVLDALGRPVLTATADAAGTAALVLPAGLPTGVYLVRTGSRALRLTVE